MMDETEFESLMKTVKAPTPSTGLADRILNQAAQTPQTQEAANDRRPIWKPLAAIAACLVAMGFAALQVSGTTSLEDEAWAQMADNTGFTELYAWVNDAEATP
jgi:hypothetical protein